jgi:hypothetical protein
VSTTWIRDLLQLVDDDFPETSRERIRSAPVGRRKKVARLELRQFRKSRRETADLPHEMPPLEEGDLQLQWSSTVTLLGEQLTAQVFAATELHNLRQQGAGDPAEVDPLLEQACELVAILKEIRTNDQNDQKPRPPTGRHGEAVQVDGVPTR